MLRRGPEQKAYSLGFVAPRSIYPSSIPYWRQRALLEKAARECLDLRITRFDPRLGIFVRQFNRRWANLN
jgi:hypothetical protein